MTNHASCSVSSILCDLAISHTGAEMHTKIIQHMVLHALFHCSIQTSFLFHLLPPHRVMKCLSHSRLQYVFIDSRVRTLCVCTCVRVYVCVWVDGCLEVTLPKTRDPESNDSPLLPDTATRRADITCPKTKSYSSLWPHYNPGLKGKCQRLSVTSAPKRHCFISSVSVHRSK